MLSCSFTFLPLLKIALDNWSVQFHFHTFDVSTNTKTITVMSVQKRMKLSSSGEGNDLDLAVDKNEMQWFGSSTKPLIRWVSPVEAQQLNFTWTVLSIDTSR